ncbi:MAG: hypothetical protein HY917_04270, partial [Candidatus Diapherotrites archaeon]|nr:hypothetical protein [Candidatus Diapherotrites archaeon]
MDSSASLKEKILQVILSEDPLTARQIHLRLARHFAVSTSYQATHKALLLLTQEKKLTKTGHQYSLSPEWVTQTEKTAGSCANPWRKKSFRVNLDSMPENASVNVECEGILDTGWFLVDKLMKAPNPQKKPCLALWRFCYSVIGLEERHLKGLREAFAQNKWFLLVSENNEVDRMFGKTLEDYGAQKTVFRVPCTTRLSDKMVIGDYVAEITYPSFFRKMWELQNRL